MLIVFWAVLFLSLSPGPSTVPDFSMCFVPTEQHRGAARCHPALPSRRAHGSSTPAHYASTVTCFSYLCIGLVEQVLQQAGRSSLFISWGLMKFLRSAPRARPRPCRTQQPRKELCFPPQPFLQRLGPEPCPGRNLGWYPGVSATALPAFYSSRGEEGCVRTLPAYSPFCKQQGVPGSSPAPGRPRCPQ